MEELQLKDRQVTQLTMEISVQLEIIVQQALQLELLVLQENISQIKEQLQQLNDWTALQVNIAQQLDSQLRLELVLKDFIEKEGIHLHLQQLQFAQLDTSDLQEVSNRSYETKLHINH